MAKLGALVPLIILFVVIGVGGFIGYSLYVWSNELTERGKNKMAKKNMSFTKEGGLRVGVKEMRDEKYADKTQNVLVNVWNNASLPNYKSRLGWNSTQGGVDSKKAAKANGDARPTSSRTSSSSSSRPAPAAVSHFSPAEKRPTSKRTTSTPGGWD